MLLVRPHSNSRSAKLVDVALITVLEAGHSYLTVYAEAHELLERYNRFFVHEMMQTADLFHVQGSEMS